VHSLTAALRVVQVTSRLAKPRLVSAVGFWLHDYKHVQRALAAQRQRTALLEERDKRESADEELKRVRNESAEKLTMVNVALIEARQASAVSQRQTAEAMQAAGLHKEAVVAARKAQELVQDEVRSLERELKLERERKQVSGEQLARMLAEQRQQLELDANLVRSSHTHTQCTHSPTAMPCTLQFRLSSLHSAH
jgi:predicted GTPase